VAPGSLSRRRFVSHPTTSAAQYFIRVFALSVLLLFTNVARGQNTISTVAGGAPANGVSPTAAPIEGPQPIARDSSGNLYVVHDNRVIYKVTPGTTAPSSMSIYAGINTAGFSPNGTLATSALLYEPIGAAIDASGRYKFNGNCNGNIAQLKLAATNSKATSNSTATAPA
jgi:hypothetical protein